jgi:hypothetical protein
MMLWERVPGTEWVVAHDTGTLVIVPLPAPPEWAPPQLLSAWEGHLAAGTSGKCPECGAARTPAAVQEMGLPVVMTASSLPHAPACPLSWAAIEILAFTLRPPGRRWIAEATDEVAAIISTYAADLAEGLAGNGAGAQFLSRRARSRHSTARTASPAGLDGDPGRDVNEPPRAAAAETGGRPPVIRPGPYIRRPRREDLQACGLQPRDHGFLRVGMRPAGAGAAEERQQFQRLR